MVQVDLGLVTANHVHHALAHPGNIETGGGSHLGEAQAHARQLGHSREQVSLRRQLVKDLRSGHDQPLVLLDTALVNLYFLDNLVDGVLEPLLHIHGELPFYAHFNCGFHRVFHALLDVDGNLFLNGGFHRGLNALLDADGQFVLDRALQA